MLEEGEGSAKRTEVSDGVVHNSVSPSSSTLDGARIVRDVASCGNVQTISAQSIDFARPSSVSDVCSHGKYHKSNSNDFPPPSYADTIYDYKHIPQQTCKLQHVNSTQTREAREAEAIASDNRRKYKERVKFCKRFTIFAAFFYALSAIYLVQWHKKIAVRSSINQEEALRNIVFVTNTNDSNFYEGKLVHIVGQLSMIEPIVDPECGFSLFTVKLKRFVHDSEIYMMIKNKPDNDDDNTSEAPPRYYYTRKGGDILLRSNQMCVNPINHRLKRWDVKNNIQTAKIVKIGNFTLSEQLKDQFNEFVYVTDKLMELTNDNAVRLIFSYAGRAGDTYSVIGKAVDGYIVPYRTQQGDEILLKTMYAMTAEEMIRSKRFNVDFEFYRRSYVMSLIIIFLSISLVYYCKIHPLIPHGRRT